MELDKQAIRGTCRRDSAESFANGQVKCRIISAQNSEFQLIDAAELGKGKNCPNGRPPKEQGKKVTMASNMQ